MTDIYIEPKEDNEVLVGMWQEDWDAIVKSLEVFKGTEKYSELGKEQKDNIDNLIKKLRRNW